MAKKITRFTFFIALAINLLSCTEEPPSNPSINTAAETLIQVSTGQLIGFSDEENTYAWLGIPYASAPVGDLRWRAPRAPKAWQGVRESLAFNNVCPQFGNIGVSSPKDELDKLVGSEDCLFLNVWAPKAIIEKQKRTPLPVMLWIHGGGNSIGTANTYDFARVLAGKQSVIVVTINYRLSILGWLHHPALATHLSVQSKTANEFLKLDQSGNFGTLDIIQSLKWVNENIAAFGGDPDNVTIFGESAGGMNVYSLMLSPLAKGLFHKAISQSGGIKHAPVPESENYRDELPAGDALSAKEIALTLAMFDKNLTDRDASKAYLAAQTDEQLAAWLRGLPLETIFSTFDSQKFVMGMLGNPKVFQDGYVLPLENAASIIKNPSLFNAVPLITGTNRDEMKTFMMMDPRYVKKWFGIIPSILDEEKYHRIANYASNIWRITGADLPATVLSNTEGHPPVFTYRFDFDQLKDNWLLSLSELLGAGHGFEINYAFGLDRMPNSSFNIHSDETLVYRQSLAYAMSSYWANFAYTGEPSKGRNDDLPLWQAWDNKEGGPKTLLLNADNKGGIRQINQVMTVSSLKQEILADSSLQGQQQLLCETYSGVFYDALFGRGFFNQEEYNHLGQQGCLNYPIEKTCGNLPGSCN